MSIFGAANAPLVNQSIKQAAKPASGAERRRAAATAPDTTRGEDEVDLAIQGSAGEGAVRSLKGNADQETADDREQQDHYKPQTSKAPANRPSLDIQG